MIDPPAIEPEVLPDPPPAGDVAVAADLPGVRPARGRRTLKNALANGTSRVVSVVASFLLTPVILHAVGTDAFGLWVLVGSVVAYGSLLDLGIGGALTKYVAEHQATGDVRSTRSVIAAGLRLYVGLGAIAALLGLGLAAVAPTLFRVPDTLAGTAGEITALMAVGLGVAIPCTTATAVLRGLHRYDLAAAIAVVGTVASVATTLGALALGWGVLGIVALGIPIPIATQLLAIAAIRRIEPALLDRGGERAPGATRRIVAFSWPLFLLDIAGRLQTKTDEIVVGVALALGSVTPYALGRKLSTIPRLIAEQFTMLLLPLASELHARDEHERLRSLYLVGVRTSLAIALPLTTALIVLAGPILDAWVGPDYEGGAAVVVILAIASVVDLSLWPAGFVLQGIARHRWLAPIALGSGVANLILSLALARPLGLVGVALGTLLPTTIEALVVLTPFTLRTLNITPGRFASEALVPALWPVIPASLLLIVLRALLAPTSVASIVVLVILVHAAYGVAYLANPAAGLERRVIGGLVSDVRSVRWRSGGRP